MFIETPLERRGMNPAKDISLYHLYCSIIKQIRPDLVVTYTVKPNVYGGMACRKLRYHMPRTLPDLERQSNRAMHFEHLF